MTSKKRFNKLIDDLRIIAAILVVAIHTAPLFEYNEFISYFITNIIGRLAVPYFFVLSGYFLFKKFKHQNDEERMETFVKTEKNLLIMYGLTLIIYIPVWLYLHQQGSTIKYYNACHSIVNRLQTPPKDPNAM